MSPALASLLADLLLVLHVLFILFVVLGQLLIMIGAWRPWAWVRNLRFRIAHLIAIGIVVAQAWAGMWCPLTMWEDHLRRTAGHAGYDTTFIAHWLGRLIYFEAPLWAFTLVYSIFAGLVIAFWFIVRPQQRPR